MKIVGLNAQKFTLFKACNGSLFFYLGSCLAKRIAQEHLQRLANQVLIQDLVVDDDSELSTFLKRISGHFLECCTDQYQVTSVFVRKRSPTLQDTFQRQLKEIANSYTLFREEWDLD